MPFKAERHFSIWLKEKASSLGFAYRQIEKGWGHPRTTGKGFYRFLFNFSNNFCFNSAIKREQNQVGLNYAEREQIQRS